MSNTLTPVSSATVPTKLVSTTGPLATPEAYVVPGSLEIQLSSVAATFDGTGAGGSFDPTLSVYSKDGKLISRTKVGSTVAAGGSAVCTWIPFSRKQAAATPAAGSLKAIQFYTITGFTVPGGNDQAVSFDHVSSFDSATFGTLTSGGRTNRVILKKQGAYACFAWLDWGSHVGLKTTWMYNLAPIGPLITPAMQSQVYDLGGLTGTPGQLSYVRVMPADFSGDSVPQTQFFYVGHDAPGNLITSVISWQFVYLGATDF